jgi:hypothetical protein
VVFDIFALNVHEHANAQLTTYLFQQGSGAGWCLVPKKQARIFPGTLNALSLPIWPLLIFQEHLKRQILKEVTHRLEL